MASSARLARTARRASAVWLACWASATLGCSGEVLNLGSAGLQAGGGGTVADGIWGVSSAPIFEQKPDLLLANPSLTAAEDQLYYSVQKRGGNPDPNLPYIERATSTGTAWGNVTPQPLGTLVMPDVSSPAISASGTELWFGLLNNGNTDIFKSVLQAGAWTNPLRVPELSSADDDAPRQPAVKGTIMPLSSKRHDGLLPLYQIYLSNRENENAVWGEPSKALLGPVNSDQFQSADGFLSETGLELYFSSTRAGEHTDSDLYVSRRPRLDAVFGAPDALADLNDIDGPAQERMPWLSRDGQRLYFVSDRSGQYTLYLATRLQP